MPVPSTRTHRDAILARLQTAPNLTVFDGEVPSTPPLDGDGAVKPYTVLWGGGGEPLPSSLAWKHEDLDLPFQVTCAGGDLTRCLWALDTARGVLLDQVLIVPGRSLGPIRPDGNPGPPRLDDDVEPSRHWVPALFRLLSVPA